MKIAIFVNIFIILFTLTGCSLLTKASQDGDKNVSDDTTAPLFDGVGEEKKNGNNSEKNKEAKIDKKILFFGSAGYRFAGQLGFVKALKDKNISIDVVTGTELGLLSALIYASSITDEQISWNLYKLFTEIEEFEIFSDNWFEKFNIFLDNSFFNVKIEELKTRVIVPIYDQKNKRVVYVQKGDLKSIVKMAVSPCSNEIRYCMPVSSQKVQAYTIGQIFNSKNIAYVNVMYSQIKLKSDNSKMKKVWEQMIKNSSQPKVDLIKTIDLKVDEMEMDSFLDFEYYKNKIYHQEKSKLVDGEFWN